jgi:hypothetical protein
MKRDENEEKMKNKKEEPHVDSILFACSLAHFFPSCVADLNEALVEIERDSTEFLICYILCYHIMICE